MKKDRVLCLVKEVWYEPDEQELWMDLNPYPMRKEYILPLYDHPHNDIENGQHEVHYHQDDRYASNTMRTIHKFSSFKSGRIILPLEDGEYLEYRMLYKISEEHTSRTHVSLIKNSKLKHKCIHKGKCPHRGFDLTNVEAKDGIITCPLHSLQFDSKTKQLITNEKI